MANTTGNFLLFSQYTDDLARSVVDTNYKVSPSRFVCMSLGNKLYNNSNTLLNNYMPSATVSGLDGNSNGPGFFQNIFENGICLLKNDQTISKHNFSASFWGRLAQLVSGAENSGNNSLKESIKYFGDIDIESWEDGFADIIVDIKSGSYGKTMSYNQNTTGSSNWGTLSNFINACGTTQKTQGNYISGWVSGDNLLISGSLSSGNKTIPCGALSGTSTNIDNGSDSTSIFEQIFNIDSPTNLDSFTFDTVLLMYDIIDPSTDEQLAKDIPLGIYFTGDIDSSNHTIKNPVTIYSQSSNAYGAGSGWSLRIATKFSSLPKGTLKVEELAIESGAMQTSLSAQLSACAELIKTVHDGFSKNLKELQDIYDMMNQFRNDQKVNVPYIKDDGYWYVNGKNTGKPATMPAIQCDSESITEIVNAVNNN